MGRVGIQAGDLGQPENRGGVCPLDQAIHLLSQHTASGQTWESGDRAILVASGSQGYDFDRNEITVRDGKGEEDRVTMLPECLHEQSRRHDNDLYART